MNKSLLDLISSKIKSQDNVTLINLNEELKLQIKNIPHTEKEKYAMPKGRHFTLVSKKYPYCIHIEQGILTSILQGNTYTQTQNQLLFIPPEISGTAHSSDLENAIYYKIKLS